MALILLKQKATCLTRLTILLLMWTESQNSFNSLETPVSLFMSTCDKSILKFHFELHAYDQWASQQKCFCQLKNNTLAVNISLTWFGKQ